MRGDAVDRYDDEIDIDTIVATDVPASILEKPVTGARPSSGRKDTPRGYFLRVWRSVDVQQSDRIRDQVTDRTFVVLTDAPTTNPVGLGSTRLDLQRVT